ncbi:hypothetical protein [Sphingomonas sp. PB4P5]|uniref:hypothetical protein n=1 Tax=Parasphingomonas puruogangriensis TaxID=3096155 RepID=UPI002FC5E8E7
MPINRLDRKQNPDALVILLHALRHRQRAKQERAIGSAAVATEQAALPAFISSAHGAAAGRALTR